jgi:hypothetical protein
VSAAAGELADEHQGVVPSVSVANLVAQRAGILERFAQIFALLDETQALARNAQLAHPRVCIDQSWQLRGGVSLTGERSLEERAEGVRRVVDASGWLYLMRESGMQSLMDHGARESWRSKIERGEFPPLTPENIASTFEALHDARAVMFERGVIACFRHISWRYKTNQPQAFGKRLIVSGISEWHGTHPSPRRADELDDLMRVFYVLDGRPEPDMRQQGMNAQIGEGLRSTRSVDNQYLSIRLYRNGNGHVTFKRLDLVDKMNRILAKHHPNALPAPRDARR